MNIRFKTKVNDDRVSNIYGRLLDGCVEGLDGYRVFGRVIDPYT